MTNKKDVMNAMYCAVDGLNIAESSGANTVMTVASTADGISNAVYTYNPFGGTSLWDYWHTHYYPYVIRESYPVYIQERAVDKGKQAFELLKALMDKGLVKVDKVKDFVEAMDTILKTL